MTGKGQITRTPKNRLRAMMVFHLLWLAVVFLLGGWWGSLLLKQAARIEELERLAGVSTLEDVGSWERTQRMIYWESGAFFSLLAGISALLLWFYWRDAQRARGLQAFFASVTHELRTPLTSIRLQAESIADSLAKEHTEEHTLVERLLEDTMRLESQVERTLELARVEGGGPVYVQSIRIKPWVDRILKPWRETQGDRIEIENRLDDIQVMADPAAIQVIFKNLLENSIRHSKREKLKITLCGDFSDDFAVIRFRDNGEGFQGTSSRLGKIFQKGPSSQGAGVGLYLVRVLMERMGGSAQFGLSSTEAAGFEVTLKFKGGDQDG